MLAMLMLQLKSFSRSFMVVLTAPLRIIEVALVLLVFRQPFGFVAMLGAIALGGMIMRSTVILVDQIDQDMASGLPAWAAIGEATVRRFHPIALTAAAAVLAMIPLTRSVLWGPMAYTIMAGASRRHRPHAAVRPGSLRGMVPRARACGQAGFGR
jgi:multidrug efflux pump